MSVAAGRCHDHRVAVAADTEPRGTQGGLVEGGRRRGVAGGGGVGGHVGGVRHGGRGVGVGWGRVGGADDDGGGARGVRVGGACRRRGRGQFRVRVVTGMTDQGTIGNLKQKSLLNKNIRWKVQTMRMQRF